MCMISIAREVLWPPGCLVTHHNLIQRTFPGQSTQDWDQPLTADNPVSQIPKTCLSELNFWEWKAVHKLLTTEKMGLSHTVLAEEYSSLEQLLCVTQVHWDTQTTTAVENHVSTDVSSRSIMDLGISSKYNCGRLFQNWKRLFWDTWQEVWERISIANVPCSVRHPILLHNTGHSTFYNGVMETLTDRSTSQVLDCQGQAAHKTNHLSLCDLQEIQETTLSCITPTATADISGPRRVPFHFQRCGFCWAIPH